MVCFCCGAQAEDLDKHHNTVGECQDHRIQHDALGADLKLELLRILCKETQDFQASVRTERVRRLEAENEHLKSEVELMVSPR